MSEPVPEEEPEFQEQQRDESSENVSEEPSDAEEQPEQDDNEEKDEGSGDKPHKKRDPFYTNPAAEAIDEINRRNDEMLRSITRPIHKALDNLNPAQKILQDIHRQRFKEATQPVLDTIRIRAPQLYDSQYITKSILDDLLSSAQTQRRISQDLAQKAETEDVSEPALDAIHASEQESESTLHEAKELSEELEFNEDGSLRDPTPEIEERFFALIEKLGQWQVDTAFRQEKSERAKLAELRRQGEETTAQHRDSQRIAIWASIVAILALIGSVPQGIAAIPQMVNLLPSWGLPWWGTTLIVVGSLLLAWGVLATWNSRHEADESRWRIMTFLVKTTRQAFTGIITSLRYVRVLAREKVDPGELKGTATENSEGSPHPDQG